MRYFRIKLKNNIIWGIHDLDLFLNVSEPLSDVIDMEDLGPQIYDIIKKSVLVGQIKILNLDGKEISLSDNQAEFTECDIADVEEDDVDFNIVSATVEEDIVVIEPEVEDYKKAEVLLGKNGNTVKKAIDRLSEGEDSIKFIKACFELEENDKKRKGVISSLVEKLGELNV